MKPEILIVDEPATGQDWRGAKEMMKILDKLNKEGKTIIVISHNMRLIAEHCKRAVVMCDGKIIFDGSVRQALSHPEALEKASIKPPMITEFARKLSDYGFPNDVLTVKEMLDLSESLINPEKQ